MSPWVMLCMQVIENYITGCCICLLNNGQNTNFPYHSMTFRVIDVVICSLIFYGNFSVCNDRHSSHNFSLFLSLHNFKHSNHKSSRCIYDKAEWITISSNAMIIPALIEGGINGAVVLFTKILLTL